MTVKKLVESERKDVINRFEDLQDTCLKLNNVVHKYDSYCAILLDAARTATNQA